VQCFAVTAAVVVVSMITERPAETGVTAAPGPPPILERVPLPQRGALLALIVEDHYVDIVTERGKTLVLMRLADAIRETTGVPGLQIHRSHWVACAAVVKAHRSDGKVVLELSNGLRLPVSRGYLPAARDAGLVV
jgi:DNA-binding LytR/AlgR family response regulator